MRRKPGDMGMYKILLVDDEFTERDGMKFLIKKFKLPLIVAEAENGRKALEYIRKNNVDILLTDVRMPYMDGLELSGEVAKYSPDTVIIIFSAYSEFEYAKKACEVNAVNYLLKPIEIEEFEQVMTKVIHLCDERSKRLAMQENLKLAEKKYLLYQMFQSKTYKPEYALRLKAFDINLDYRYNICISIETVKNYFEMHEDELEEHLTPFLKQDFELISLCPNQAYLLLYSYNTLNEDYVTRIAQKLYSFITQEGHTQASVIIGKAFYGSNDFLKRVLALEELRGQFFNDTFGIQQETQLKLTPAGENLRKDWFMQQEAILEAVKAKNLVLVRSQISSFIGLLEQNHSVSALYSKYILVDIIKAVFSQYGVYNQTVLFQATDQIMKCVSLKDMENLLYSYLDEMQRREEETREDQSTPVTEIKKIISNEYMADLSLEDIAGRICLAPGYVSYIFKQETGQNLIKYLTDYRMEKAEEMLRRDNRKITDIAKACGYQNQSYFNKLFKNYYAMTPKQYREKLYEK